MLAVVHQQIEDAVLCRSPVGICYRKDGETTGAEQNWVKFADAFSSFFLFFFAAFVLHSLNSHTGGVCQSTALLAMYV